MSRRLLPGRAPETKFGANAFPHNSSYNPTGPVGALAYWTADAIKNRYVKSPGPLVQA